MSSVNKNSFITIDMALNLKEFKTYEIISGMKGTNRKIKWVHIIELANLETSLNGGELILTTGKEWITNPEYAIPFIKKLIKSDCAGLCIELHTKIAEIPSAIFQIAEDHHLPIIVFNERVKFMEITRAIYDLIYSKTPPMGSVLLNQIWSMESRDSLELETIYSENNCGILVLIRNEVEAFINYFQKTSLYIQIFRTYISSYNATLFLITSTLNTVEMKNEIKNILQNSQEKLPNSILVSPFFSNNQDLFNAVEKLKRLLRIAKEFQYGSSTILYEDVHIEKVLYLLDPKYLKQLTDEYLGKLIEFDEQNQSELVLTLKTLIELNGNRKEAAKKLFISRQTIYYRIETIKNLLKVNFEAPNKKIIYELLLYNLYHRI